MIKVLRHLAADNINLIAAIGLSCVAIGFCPLGGNAEDHLSGRVGFLVQAVGVDSLGCDQNVLSTSDEVFEFFGPQILGGAECGLPLADYTFTTHKLPLEWKNFLVGSNHSGFHPNRRVNCWTLAPVCPHSYNLHGFTGNVIVEMDVASVINTGAYWNKPRSNLLESRLARNFYSVSGRFIGASSEKQSPNQKGGTKRHSAERQPRGTFHALSGFVHRLRGISHALLGDKIVLLSLGALLFAALAGLGGFLVFDDPNRNSIRLRFGWLFLTAGPFLSAGCLLLGLQ